MSNLNVGVPPWEQEEYVAIGKAMKDFADKEIRPKAREMERNGEVPRSLLKQMGDLGFFGVSFPEEYGGMGLGAIGDCVIAKELAAADPSTAVVFGAHADLGCAAVNLFGTEDQKQRYLVPGILGDKIGALATTEPSVGSDIAGMQTKAVKVDGGWILNGEKQFITNGGRADFVIIFAQTDPKDARLYDQSKPRKRHQKLAAFIVDTASTGFSAGKSEDKLSIRASNTSSLALQDVFVPDANLLGKPGEAFKMVLTIFNRSRITLTASCVGIVGRALEEAMSYAKNRMLFGESMLNKQNTQMKLAEIEATRSFIHSAVMCAAWKVDRGLDIKLDAAVVKYLGPELAFQAVDKALQLHGGSGNMTEYFIEKLFRDIRVWRVFEGTSEVQELTIASELLSFLKP